MCVVFLLTQQVERADSCGRCLWVVMAAITGQEGGARASRLSQSLHEILTHFPTSPLLDCFLHFMEFVDALPLVHFWFSVQAFKSSPAVCGHTESHPDTDAELHQGTKTAHLVCASCSSGPTEANRVTTACPQHRGQHGCHDSEEGCVCMTEKQYLCNGHDVETSEMSRDLTGSRGGSWFPVGREECVNCKTVTEDTTGEHCERDHTWPNLAKPPQLESMVAQRKPLSKQSQRAVHVPLYLM